MQARPSLTRLALAVVATVVAACGAGSPASSGSLVASNAPALVGQSAIPSDVSPLADAKRVLGRLDTLAILFAQGDMDATGAWGREEGTWVAANVNRLAGEAGLALYPQRMVDLLTAIGAGADQTAAIKALLEMRREIGVAHGLIAGATPAPTAAATVEPTPDPTPEPTPEPTPVPTPDPTERPVSYAKLTPRTWAQLVKAPDNYVGNTYQVWGCISQFDAATGLNLFRAEASYQKEAYWFSDGVNAYFTGDEDQLADFVQDDVIVMGVTSLGSYSYDTQNGGNTTVPLFQVEKITRKGTC